jgi:hypothetical protein
MRDVVRCPVVPVVARAQVDLEERPVPQYNNNLLGRSGRPLRARQGAQTAPSPLKVVALAALAGSRQSPLGLSRA